MSDIRAIETYYDGCRFRSRLEARWAVFFNAAGIEYQYEPEGFVLSDGSWYLPDFYLPGIVKNVNRDCPPWFVEVKGNLSDEEGLRKARLLHESPPWDAWGCIVVNDALLHERAEWPHRDIITGEWMGTEAGFLAQRLGLPSYAYDRAAEAARTARFEHGEKPAVSKAKRRT